MGFFVTYLVWKKKEYSIDDDDDDDDDDDILLFLLLITITVLIIIVIISSSSSSITIVIINDNTKSCDSRFLLQSPHCTVKCPQHTPIILWPRLCSHIAHQGLIVCITWCEGIAQLHVLLLTELKSHLRLALFPWLKPRTNDTGVGWGRGWGGGGGDKNTW